MSSAKSESLTWKVVGKSLKYKEYNNGDKHERWGISAWIEYVISYVDFESSVG